MSSDRRFEQELPSLLDDLYMGSMPTYRDHVLQQTARTRQRPAWLILERWLPMVDIAGQPVLLRRLPWRTIGLVVVLMALLVVVLAALAVGGRPNLPAPFGPAGNGLVAYASGGDVYTVNPVTGKSTAIVTGPGDAGPRWSRDGTRLAFTRPGASAGTSLLYVVAADGSGLLQITPQPLFAADMATYTFSPDGKEILISASPGVFTHFLIAATDGSGVRTVNLPVQATDAAWRPPDGSEILFQDDGGGTNGTDSGIYAINAQNLKLRTILAGADAAGRFRGHAAWSPDGSLISFGEWRGLTNIDVKTHIIAADGTGDRTLPMPAGAMWQAPESWSNDGTRLLVIRGYSDDLTQSRPVAIPVIPVTGSGFGVEIPYPGGIGTPDVSDWEWAPDDTSILGTPADASGTILNQVLLDPVAATSRTPPWASVSQPSWQRLGR